MKTRNIAVAVGLQNAFGQGVAKGVADFALLHPEWSLLSFETDDLLRPGFFDHYSIDGVVVHLSTPEMAGILHRSGKPFVNVSNREFSPPVTTVTSEDFAVGALVARYFIDKGFRSVAFIGHQGKLSFRERREGFVAESRKDGLEFHDFWIKGEDVTAHYLLPNERRLEQWMQKLVPPVGVLVSSDRFALYFIDFCHKHGFRVPEDFSVVGVDNDPLKCRMSRIALSSVELGVENIGFRAAKVLSDLFSGIEPASARILVPPVRVVERASSEHFSVSDPLVHKVLDYIRAHLSEPIEVGDLAAFAMVSRRTLERHWRKVMNSSPQTEVRKLRVGRAKELLLTTDLTCKEIATSIGLPDSRSLTLLFQQMEGCKPTDIRKAAHAQT